MNIRDKYKFIIDKLIDVVQANDSEALRAGEMSYPDKAIEALIAATIECLPPEKDIDWTHPMNEYAEWPKQYTGWNDCLSDIKRVIEQ